MFKTIRGSIREFLIRSAQFVLGLDGVLHILEVVSAIEEGATRTAILTSVHACIFFVGVYFIGHDQSHHRDDEHHHHEESDA